MTYALSLPLGLSRGRTVKLEDMTPEERAAHDEYWSVFDWGYDPSDYHEDTPQGEAVA